MHCFGDASDCAPPPRPWPHEHLRMVSPLLCTVMAPQACLLYAVEHSFAAKNRENKRADVAKRKGNPGMVSCAADHDGGYMQKYRGTTHDYVHVGSASVHTATVRRGGEGK